MPCLRIELKFLAKIARKGLEYNNLYHGVRR